MLPNGNVWGTWGQALKPEARLAGNAVEGLSLCILTMRGVAVLQGVCYLYTYGVMVHPLTGSPPSVPTWYMWVPTLYL